ncbi:MAG: DNA primase [Actinobacteria bacterium]|nr:DNA primase [Actinomycetota bacterium]
MIDSTTIRQVQDAADILDVIGEHVALKRAGKNFLGLCPFHEEKTPSFSVSPSKSIFKCFGCGAGGSIFQFIMRKDRVSFPEAVESLAQRLGIPIARSQPSPTAQRKVDLASVNSWAAGVFRSNLQDQVLGRSAREYLATRGLSPQIQEQFKLGLALPGWDGLIQTAASTSRSAQSLAAAGLVTARESGQGWYDRFRNRLIFPIVDASQRVIAFAGRSLELADEKSGAKYLNSPETPLFSKSSCLYGLDQARDSIVRKNQAVVVEGYTDCLMAHQHGLTNVVATMGTALTDLQAGLLRRFCERVVVVFDSDQAGLQAADRAIDVFLGQRIQLSVAAVPQGKDPCDYIISHGIDAFGQIVDHAVDALEYKWQLARRAQQDSDSPAGQHRAIEQFLASLARSAHFGSSDPIWRGLLLNHIAKLLSMSPVQVLAVVNQLKSRTARRVQPADPSGPVSTASAQTPLSAMDKALRQVLEVLLNKPSYIEKVAGVIAPEDFSQADLQTVAEAVFKWAGDTDQPQLSDLLAGQSSLDQADLITSLAEQGSRKGNFQPNLSGAMDYICSYRQRRNSLDAAESIRRADSDLSDEQVNELLQQVQSQLKTQNRRNPGIRV